MCLDVYETQDGYWNPDHGDVEVPPGWEFLASGDAFVTRRVKADGHYWQAWLPKTRSRQHRRLIGLWAPKATIDAAGRAAEESATTRAKKRDANARGHAAHEQRYQRARSVDPFTVLQVCAWPRGFTDDGERPEEAPMNITYRVRFEDERRTRSRVFEDHEAARWWASRNRPEADYVIVARYQNALHAAIAYLLKRREPTVPGRIHAAARR
jgi:hypothetical protein